jgi:four helix bundle protein
MLRVQVRYVGLLSRLVPVLAAIERRNGDLHRQIHRALESAALNMGEGSGNEGGTRRQRFLSSLGSLREALVGLEVAAAFGYVVPPVDLMRDLSGCVGTLVVLVHGRR